MLLGSIYGNTDSKVFPDCSISSRVNLLSQLRSFPPTQKKKPDNIAIASSLSYGVYANLGEDGNATLICSDFVFGKNKHHFETDIGVAFNHEDAVQGGGSVPDRSPCIRICYRIQQKSKPFFFKTGLGYPEGIFVAVGLAF